MKTSSIKKIASARELLMRNLPLALLIGVSIPITIMNPVFLTWNNFMNIFMQYSGVALIALGSMIVLISGGMDFTPAEVVACGSVIGGLWYQSTGNNILFLFLGVFLVAVFTGLINGTLISYIGFPPFIATLAMQAIIHGFMLFFAEGNIIQLEGPVVSFLGKAKVGGIPVSFWVLLVFSILLWFIMNRTKLGVYAYALGGNARALEYSGVNVRRYTLYIYVTAGLCYAIGTILIATRMAAIYSSVNSTLLLDGIAATVLGGTSMSGGKGSVIGTIIGAIIIGVIANALILLKVPSTMHDVVKGLIIVLALMIDVVVNRINKS